MQIADLISAIEKKKSYLCVGLDTAIDKLPKHLGSEPESMLKFNQAIIESTAPYAVSYKINTAFYEQYGTAGWEVMRETLNAIPKDCFTIADAKRGDIGNTGEMYARAFLDNLNFDSITVSPYMGRDSVEPFMREGKTVIVLGLTSNPGSKDFQYLKTGDRYLFETVIDTCSSWGNSKNMMFVVGATRSEMISRIRKIIPNHFLLVPGVGAQGGSLEEVSHCGMNSDTGLLINSSRGIIYASSGEDYAEVAAQKAKELSDQMSTFMADES